MTRELVGRSAVGGSFVAALLWMTRRSGAARHAERSGAARHAERSEAARHAERSEASPRLGVLRRCAPLDDGGAALLWMTGGLRSSG